MKTSSPANLRKMLYPLMMLLSLPALAHEGHSDASLSAFAEGLMHPFHGFDHWLPLLAAGLLASQVRLSVTLPLLFPSALLSGMLVSLLCGIDLLSAPLILLSVISLGMGFVLLSVVTTRLELAIGSIFGLLFLQGAAHVPNLPHGQELLPHLTGLIVGSMLISLTAALTSHLWSRFRRTTVSGSSPADRMPESQSMASPSHRLAWSELQSAEKA